ncbi:uncharacterized protein LOC116344213 [Contarinia nasturtii]|uniref:uncharacterized protein LOC116344213 n=1 Tax=Contarinia nasturtii TaxID=265458 RepID=UPI0012D3F068|nr:uncharacterized protein LOC116344213 [Contarinia nasturtii]
MTCKVNILFVILLICLILCKVNAFEYKLEVDEQPLVSERFSADDIGNGESVKSREIINRVHHKHEQNFGDIHVQTNIHIENVVTIRNVSDSNSSGTTSQPNYMKNVPGSTIQSNPTKMVNGRPQFRRLDRNQGVNSFAFPTSLPSSEQSRHVRWPSERSSTNGIDPVSIGPIQSTVLLSRSDRNESATLNNDTKQPQSASIEIQSNKGNEPALPNLLNIQVFVNNKMAIESGLEPLAYVDDKGIFKVKYVKKGENVTTSNTNQLHHLEGHDLTSINKPNETAIIFNDNQQNHRIITESNKKTTPTIDSIQNYLPINNSGLKRAQQKDAPSSQPQQQNQLHQNNIHEQLLFSP